MSASIEVVFPGFTLKGDHYNQTIDGISSVAGNFHSSLSAQDRKPKFCELMFFNLMKTKVTFHQNFLSEDYNHLNKQGWLDMEFYSEKDITRFKSIIAKTLVRLKVIKLLKSNGLNNAYSVN